MKKLITLVLVLLLVSFAHAAIPNPGHKASEIGGASNADRTFNGTSSETYTFPTNLIVDTSLGIGISSTSEELQVEGTTDIGALIKATDSASYSKLLLGTNNADNAGYMIAYGSTHGSQANQLSFKSTYGDMTFYTGAAGSSDERMRIDTSGNIGIGISSPSASHKLHVLKDNQIAMFESTSTTTSSYAEIHMKSTGGTTVIGSIAEEYTQADWADSAYIYNSNQDHFWIKNGLATGDFAIFTGGHALANRRLYIDSEGKTGIGTTTPDSRLQVVGVDTGATTWQHNSFPAGSITAEFGENTAGYAGALKLWSYTAGQFVFQRPSNGNYHIDSTTGHYYFNWDSDIVSDSTGEIHIANGADSTERVRLSAASDSFFIGGNVGIGDSSPDALLDVEGTMYANYYARDSHSQGHLVGSYNSVAANADKSNPIYTIGSDYNPTDSALSNMYGIGYAHDNFWYDLLGVGRSDSSWGMYVAADGDIRATISGANGDIWSTGDIYLDGGDANIGTAGAKVYAGGNGVILAGNTGDASLWVYNDEVYIGDGNDPIHIRGNIDSVDSFSFESADGRHDPIYRVGGLYFTWDADSYGTNNDHSIRSVDEAGAWTDDIRINSYDNIINVLDTNNNGASSYFKVGHHTADGDPADLFYVNSPTGNGYFAGILQVGSYLASSNCVGGAGTTGSASAYGNTWRLCNAGSNAANTWLYLYNGAGSTYHDLAAGSLYSSGVLYAAGGDLRIGGTGQFTNPTADVIYTPDDLRADNFLVDTNTVINDAAITITDSNRYVWTPYSGWGEYWDTTNNQIDFMGGGVERGYIDLDNGNLQLDGDLTVDGNDVYIGDATVLRDSGSYTYLESDQHLYLHAGTASSTGFIEVKPGEDNYGFIIRDYDSTNWANLDTNDGYLTIGYMSSDGPLYLDDNDNVGVGTSSPGSYKLNVAGDVEINGRNDIDIGSGSVAGYVRTTGTTGCFEFYDSTDAANWAGRMGANSCGYGIDSIGACTSGTDNAITLGHSGPKLVVADAGVGISYIASTFTSSSNKPDADLHVAGGVCIDTDASCTDPGNGNLHVQGYLGLGASVITTNNIRLNVGGPVRIEGTNARLTLPSSGNNQWNIDNNGGTIRFFTETYSATGGMGGGSVKMYLDAEGDLGIGAAPGTTKLYVSGSTWSTTGWSSSDIRWKKNIKDTSYGLNDIMKLRPVNYDWRIDEFENISFSNRTQIGFIAQEVEPLIPEIVNTNHNGYKAISYDKITPINTKAIQELKIEKDLEIKNLQEKFDKLEEENQILREAICEINPFSKICVN